MNRAARGGIGDRERLGQDLLHPRIRREGLALDDADGGDRSHQLGVERRGRFLLHDLVEHLVETEVVRRNGVHHLAAAFVEHGRRWRSWAGEFGLAGQELGDAGADAAGFVGIDLGGLPDQLDHRLRIVVLHERATEITTRVVRDRRRSSRPRATGPS